MNAKRIFLLVLAFFPGADQGLAASPVPPAPLAEELAPSVFALGSDHRYRSANAGWVIQKDQQLLIDLPRGVSPERFLAEMRERKGTGPLVLALTRYERGDAPILAAFLAAGVQTIHVTPAILRSLTEDSGTLPPDRVVMSETGMQLGTGENRVEFIPLDGILPGGSAAIYLPGRETLFAGPLVINGPRLPLAEARTGPWISALRRLERLPVRQVVPGYGSWAGPGILADLRAGLEDLRARVGHLVARGQSQEALTELQQTPADLPWQPYSQPSLKDFEHLYHELRVPEAPFNGMPPDPVAEEPHALVLIGDRPHDPGRIEKGLRPVFEATGVTPHFAVDVETLTATNLFRIDLLVIFRDGHLQPDGGPGKPWMTIEQQRAVSDFVSRGGSFLNLHNAMGLYPEKGPYLDLVGGQYAGHGPLERFRVEVVDPDHPVNRGVTDFFVADEQHTPPFDEQRCHLLLRNRSLDGNVTAAAGWVREPGKGRLCYLANGHTSEALEHPMFQRLLGNAVNWLLRRDENSGDPTP